MRECWIGLVELWVEEAACARQLCASERQRRAGDVVYIERRTEDRAEEMGVADHHDRLGGGVLDLLTTWKGREV